jgi:hypothetical protein
VGPMHVVLLDVDAAPAPDVGVRRSAASPALGADRAGPALRERVGVRGLDRCQHHLGAFRAEGVIEGAAEPGVTVAEQQLDSSSLLAEHQQQVRAPAGQPRRRRGWRSPGQMDPPVWGMETWVRTVSTYVSRSGR